MASITIIGESIVKVEETNIGGVSILDYEDISMYMDEELDRIVSLENTPNERILENISLLEANTETIKKRYKRMQRAFGKHGREDGDLQNDAKLSNDDNQQETFNESTLRRLEKNGEKLTALFDEISTLKKDVQKHRKFNCLLTRLTTRLSNKKITDVQEITLQHMQEDNCDLPSNGRNSLRVPTPPHPSQIEQSASDMNPSVVVSRLKRHTVQKCLQSTNYTQHTDVVQLAELTAAQGTTSMTADSFECEICGKAFSRKQALHGHMAHHGKKRKSLKVAGDATCSICNRVFATCHGLRIHARVHSRRLKQTNDSEVRPGNCLDMNSSLPFW